MPIVRLTAEDGTQGLGEAWCGADGFDVLVPALRDLAGRMIGRACHDLPIWSDAWPDGWPGAAAWSAFDIARWDARARAGGVPLFRLLGGTDAAIPVYASGGLYRDGGAPGTREGGPDAVRTEMAGHVAAGFRDAKMKIGALALPNDLRRVRAAREVLGDGWLIVDAVGQLARDRAPAWCDALARLGVRDIQAPLPDADLDGLAALGARGPLRVIAGERMWQRRAFDDLLRTGAAGVLQFCPGLAGGVTGGLRLLAEARAAGVPVTLQCFSTAVMQMTCLHLTAAAPGVAGPAEFHRFHDALYGAIPAQVADGRLRLGAAPGLGLAVSLPDDPPPGPATVRPLFTVAA